jgi:aryl-alcohol dehydrogenase-like predicted oxidoreductase
MSVLEDYPLMPALCESERLASINRTPLAMGLLTGKYSVGASFEPTDVRIEITNENHGDSGCYL